jgi:hypothetical protein
VWLCTLSHRGSAFRSGVPSGTRNLTRGGHVWMFRDAETQGSLGTFLGFHCQGSPLVYAGSAGYLYPNQLLGTR